MQYIIVYHFRTSSQKQFRILILSTTNKFYGLDNALVDYFVSGLNLEDTS